MRVLLISYFFPPDGAVGALRPAKVAAAFRSRGHDVTVLAAGPSNMPVDAQGAGVHRVTPLASPRDWYTSWKRRSAGANGKGASVVAATAIHAPVAYTPPERVPAWKRYTSSLLWLPDDKQGFIPAAYRAARRLHAVTPFDVIYTSAPPFSTHIAGMVMHGRTGVRWVAEYRDPWVGGVGKPAFVRSKATDALERWLERRGLSAADDVVVVTTGAATLLGQRRAELGRRAPILALNGIDRIERSRDTREGPIRIMYVGNLYNARDPRPFLSAVSRLRRDGQLPAEGIAIEFIGDCRWFSGEPIEQIARDLGLADVIHVRDRVPHAEVAAAMRDADVLLLLAQGQPVQVPNKLYEYLGTRRTILAFSDAEGETTAMLRRAGGHAVVTERDSERVVEIVRQALASSRCASAGDERVLSEWSTENQMTHLVRSLEHTP